MAFLIPSDYAAQIKADLLQAIISDNPAALPSAELSAQSELESYLRGRYDVAGIFMSIQPWVAKPYAAGAVVYHGTPAAVYVASDATTNTAPGAAGALWEAKDPRHPLIVTYMVDSTLYLIHSRQNPRTVPQIRQDRYDHVIEWLNLCRQGKISPGLPFLTDTRPDGTENKESIRIRSGSLKKLRNSY